METKAAPPDMPRAASRMGEAERLGDAELVESRSLQREAAAADPARSRSVLRRWRGTMLFVPLACASFGAALALAAPDVYQAQAIVLVDPDGASVLQSGSSPGPAPERRIETEAALLSSAEMQARIEDRAGRDLQYTVLVGPRTDVLTIQTEGDDPDVAAADANVVAESFVAERREIEDERAEASITVLTEEIARLETELTGIEAEVARAQAAADADADVPGPAQSLLARQNALSNQAAALETRVNEIAIEAEAGAGLPSIAAPAVPASTATAPGPILSGLVGLLVGAAVAAVLVILGNRYRPERAGRA